MGIVLILPMTAIFDLPSEDISNSVYYDVNASTLYYRVGNMRKDGFVVIPDVDSEEIDYLVEHINKAKLAIKTYINHVSGLKSIEAQNTDHLITNLLLRNINIKDLLKRTYPLMDINRLYYVCIMEPENPSLRKRNGDSSFPYQGLACVQRPRYHLYRLGRKVPCFCLPDPL